jgi:hypothetical protein
MEEAEAKAAAAIQCQIETTKAMEVDFWAQIPTSLASVSLMICWVQVVETMQKCFLLKFQVH